MKRYILHRLSRIIYVPHLSKMNSNPPVKSWNVVGRLINQRCNIIYLSDHLVSFGFNIYGYSYGTSISELSSPRAQFRNRGRSSFIKRNTFRLKHHCYYKRIT